MIPYRPSIFNSAGATWLLAVLLGGPAVAGETNAFDWKETLQVHGFLTQGYVDTTANRWFGDSEDGSFEFTEVGLNGSLLLHPRLLASVQILARNAGEMYDAFPLELDYGQLDYTAVSDESRRTGLILGRFKNPLGLHNDTRDVAFTRPSIFLPQVIYFDRTRNLLLSSDGLQLYGDIHRRHHSLYLQGGAGLPNLDENVEANFLGRDFGGDFERDGPFYVGRVLYEWDGGRLRLALSGATGKIEYDADPLDKALLGLGDGTVDADLWVASFQYNAARWGFTAEYMQNTIEWDGFQIVPGPNLGTGLDAADTTAEGYYLQGTYRLSPTWEGVLRYEEGYADRSDRDASFTKQWTAGLRWDVTPNLMLRSEYSWVNGTFVLSTIENDDPSQLKEDWEMFSLLASYRF